MRKWFKSQGLRPVGMLRTLAFWGWYPRFSVPIEVGRPYGKFQRPAVRCAEDVIEFPRVLAVAVVDYVPGALVVLLRVDAEVPGLLFDPGGVRLLRTTGEEDASRTKVDAYGS